MYQLQLHLIFLHKTPIHTAKTNHLKYLNKFGSEQIQNLINDSQLWMAEQTAKLHSQLNAQLWLVGYSELKAEKANALFNAISSSTYAPQSKDTVKQSSLENGIKLWSVKLGPEETVGNGYKKQSFKFDVDLLNDFGSEKNED